MLNIDTMNVVELETLLTAVQNEIVNRKSLAKNAKAAEKAAKAEAIAQRVAERKAKFEMRVKFQEEKRAMRAEAKRQKIAALEAKLQELKKKTQAVTPATLKKMGAAVKAPR